METRPHVNQFFCDQNADLLVYPGGEAALKGYRHEQITVGDMHGNALKLLYTLVRLKIVEMSAADYQAFISIYQLAPESINKTHILHLKQILKNIKVNDIAGLRLLGDELCDRGMNDYFTLKIIEKLHQAHVPLEILFSNHNLNFTEALESIDKTRNNPQKYLSAPCLDGNFVRSLSNMKLLIQRGVISEKEVTNIVTNCYKPHYKPLSYSLVNGSITIYSHAPIGLETIQALAAKLDVPYLDGNAAALAQTIDHINASMRQNYINNDRVMDSYDPKAMKDCYCGNELDYITDPVTALVWNRNYHHLNRPVQHNGYNIFFVHGHDMKEDNHENIYGLDNMFGKAHGHNSHHTEGEKGMFQFLHSPATPSLRKSNLFSLHHHVKKALHNASELVERKCHKVFSLKQRSLD